ncbi:hypothetical protein GCM10027280_07700 [Micromonospora polyrhachis]|uniref:Excisionase family DNA binding protein n=1 Tax=Micromonospora polyrhachis TaxID=1282883 RepID=A0A7W7WPL4_9ACTN|nr:helix-turn-helix domain-containing protein [Micromonospora polyrhachis]MBB4958368.1 excisionase family DNA binding protein [Micromonospora polyrhachis]
MNYRELLRNVRKRPGLYFGRGQLSYDRLVTFLQGLDIGAQGLVLDGFREFLVLKLDDGDNLTWWGLVERLVLDGNVGRPLNAADDQTASAGLFDLLDEFLAEMSSPGSRRRLHHEYWIWRQSRSWYDLDLARFHSSPPPPMLRAEEAMALLGASRPVLYDLIAEGKLRPARVGADLLFYERAVVALAAELQEKSAG